MRYSRTIPLSWWVWVIWSFLAVMENGETLLSDPNYEELMSEQSASNLALEGATAEARASGCHLKESFRGTWFQSGIHHAITVTKDAISTKGHCVEKEGEKYLFYNRRDNCYRCLVFSEKHLNVLQYKETFCIPEKKSLREICSTITGDANLYAMFRLEAVPMDCPFKGQFTVSYNRGQGECRSPISTMESCTKASKLVFNYQSCPEVQGSESSVEELTCLASWKEGSSRYFLGLISYQHHASYEERFRCFVYERSKHGGGGGRGDFGHGHNSHSSSHAHAHAHTSSNNYNATSGSGSGNSGLVDQIYRVAQSGDATCQGLSSMEGSRTMMLRRVPPAKPCQFPSWIPDRSHWHTLDQGSTYSFLSGNIRIANFSELAGTGPNSLAMTGTCAQILVDPSLPVPSSLGGGGSGSGEMLTAWGSDFDPTSVVIIHATSDCKTGFLCTAFHQRDDNILEIQFGSMARRMEDACQLSHFNSSAEPHVTLVASTSTLTSPASQRIPCPNVGHFKVTGLTWNGALVGGNSCRNQATLGQDDTELTNPRSSSRGGLSPGERSQETSGNSLSVGCSSTDSIQVRAKSHCDNMDVFADYSCNGWWSDPVKGITYVVTTRSSSSNSYRPQRHCFAFRDLSWSWSPPSPQLPHGVTGSRTGFQEDSSSIQDEEDDDGQPRNGGNNNNGKIQWMEFSSFADSCRRAVDVGREGDFAFNLTRIGHCSDINSAPGSHNPPRHLVSLTATLTFWAAVLLFRFGPLRI